MTALLESVQQVEGEGLADHSLVHPFVFFSGKKGELFGSHMGCIRASMHSSIAMWLLQISARTMATMLWVEGCCSPSMPLDPRVVFLARIRADSGLQQLLQDPAVAAAAVSIAHAAGFAVTAAELSKAPVASRQPSAEAAPSAQQALPATPAEGDLIDFDGDGLPDAVRHGAHWELTPQDQG